MHIETKNKGRRSQTPLFNTVIAPINLNTAFLNTSKLHIACEKSLLGDYSKVKKGVKISLK